MKNYERFNEMFKENKTPEEQAVGMVVAGILGEYGIPYDDSETDKYEEEFRQKAKWLNAEEN